jgi:hypothetical protein
MTKKTDKHSENEGGVLVNAATTIGKSLGKLARLVSRKKNTQGHTTETSKPARKKKQTTVKKVATKKVKASRKENKTVASGPSKRKTKKS